MRKKSITRLMLLAAAAVLWLACGPARSADLKAGVDKKTVALGDSVIYTIQVSGVPNPEDPVLASTKNFEIKFLGRKTAATSSLTIVVNGKVVKNEQTPADTTYFQYALTPLKTGSFILPSFAFYYGNQAFETPSFVINVVDRPKITDDLFLETALSQETAYPGQTVLLTINWYIARQIEEYEMALPGLEGGKEFIVSDPDINIPQNQAVALATTAGKQLIAQRSAMTQRGKKYVVLTVRKLLTPLSPGAIQIPPVQIRCSALTGARRRPAAGGDDFESIFSMMNSMMERPETETVTLKSNPLTLSVRELPAQGRPQDFSGGVGALEFDCGAEPLKAACGEPVTLKMTISGYTDILNVKPPALPEMPEFKAYEPETSTLVELRGDKLFGTKTVTQVLIPKTPQATVIPEIRFSYFDTQAGQYRTITRGPFALEISGEGEKASAPAAAPPQNATAPGAEKKDSGRKVQILNQDIRYIHTGDPGLKPAGGKPPYLRHWVWGPFAVFFPVAVLLFWFFGRRAKRLSTDPVYARKVLAEKNALRELDPLKKQMREGAEQEFLASINRVLTRFIADKLALPYGAVTPETLQEQPRERVPEKTAAEARELLGAAERIRFSNERVDAKTMRELYRQTQNLIHTLERTL